MTKKKKKKKKQTQMLCDKAIKILRLTYGDSGNTLFETSIFFAIYGFSKLTLSQGFKNQKMYNAYSFVIISLNEDCLFKRFTSALIKNCAE